MEVEMPAFRWSELPQEAFDPEYSSVSASVFRGEKIEAAMVTCPAATEVKTHAIPREQVHSILQGRARYRVGAEEKLVGAGEAVLVRANTSYAIQILDALEVVVFRELPSGMAVKVKSGGAGGPTFFKWDEMKSDFITPKYSAAHGPTLTGERIEVARFFFPAGTEGKAHSHPNEQIQVVLKGKAKAFIEKEEYIIGAGWGILYPINRKHGAEILENYTLLNCKDIVPDWSVYDARWKKERSG
jgi:quercetin dioxygenase-like cupin family protein